jgi:DNA polymerase
MYHPAAALHQGSLRKTIEDDFKKLPPVLKSALEEKKEPALETQQMKLF